ncbi:uncharacterized protein METZ01_LOCUS154257, partial [marine metagenome]
IKICWLWIRLWIHIRRARTPTNKYDEIFTEYGIL